MKIKLHEELDRYFESKDEFTPYYQSIKQIASSPLFVQQLKEIMDELENENSGSAKSFKLYLDAVIMNMQSKIAKYKQSVYFEDEKVREIENQGCVIPFYNDEGQEIYVLLGIFRKMPNLNNI